MAASNTLESPLIKSLTFHTSIRIFSLLGVSSSETQAVKSLPIVISLFELGAQTAWVKPLKVTVSFDGFSENKNRPATGIGGPGKVGFDLTFIPSFVCPIAEEASLFVDCLMKKFNFKTTISFCLPI